METIDNFTISTRRGRAVVEGYRASDQSMIHIYLSPAMGALPIACAMKGDEIVCAETDEHYIRGSEK